MIPAFDSDTAALTERATLNAQRSAHDLDAWILGQVDLREGMRILDLGCGTGKQIFRVAQATPAGTSILGVDISPDAVAAVNERAASEGLGNVRAVQGSLDEPAEFLGQQPFDLILSTYAIYYAVALRSLLLGLADALTPGGQVFLCGPGVGTNQELVTIIGGVSAGGEDRVDPVADWVDKDTLSAMDDAYAEVSVVRLENSVRFASAQEVLLWWRNHNSYRPALDGAVASRLEDVFAADRQFQMTKNVLGVCCRAR